MELEQKLNHCLEQSITKKTTSSTIDSANELRKIELQLNNHLREKQGSKYKKVSVVDNQSLSYNENEFADVVMKEIQNKFDQKKWGSLPMFKKWTLAKSYLEENNNTSQKTISTVRQLISSNINDRFDYDPVQQKLLHIHNI